MPAEMGQDESLESFIYRVNESTSLDVSRQAHAGTLRPAGWLKMVFVPFGTFMRLYIGRGKWRRGVRGLIASAAGAIDSLVLAAKSWEYTFREREGKGLFPPGNEEEIHRRRR